MTHEDVLDLFRTIISETELETSDYTDPELTVLLRYAAQELGVRNVARFLTLVVGTDHGESDYGFSFELTNTEGHILAHKAAVKFLRQEYTDRLKRGALGQSWRSGLEEASTISAEKAWKDTIRDVQSTLDELVAIHRAPTSGIRIQ